MKLDELSVYISRESLRFESPQVSRPLEMANLVAYRINDNVTDVVSAGETPIINPPEDAGEDALFWVDESDNTYYVFAINPYDLGTENLIMFLSEIYWKFLKEAWPYEKVEKKDFQNIILKTWMPDDYTEYMDSELQSEFEYILETKTRIGRLFVNGIESKWKPSDARMANISFIAFLFLSYFFPLLFPILFEQHIPDIETVTRSVGNLCLGIIVFISLYILVVNIVNALWAVLMRFLLPVDLVRFVFALNATEPVYKKTNQISHWLASQVLFPGRGVSL